MIRVQYLNMPGTEDLGLPFSSAVRVGNTLYLSGNLGNVPGSNDLVAGGIREETRQTTNLRHAAHWVPVALP